MRNVTTVAPPPLSIEDQSRILSFIERINIEQMEWPSVREELRRLQAALPHTHLEIVSQTENIGDDTTYCLLMKHGACVYSLSCARHNALPWQLRGATNAEANDLVTVNGYKVTVENAVHILDFIWEKEDVATRLIDMALLESEIARAEIHLHGDDLDVLLARFYDDRKLDTPKAKAQWLNGKGLTEVRLRGLLEEVMVGRKVERILVDAQFQEEWRDRPQDYAGIRVMQTAIPDECVTEVERLLRENGQERNIASIVGRLAKSVSYQYPFRIEFAELMRHEIDPSADAFGQTEGRVLLLRMATKEVRLIEIIEIESEIADSTLERRILRKLMNQWYEDQRRMARIEWHWGRSA